MYLQFNLDFNENRILFLFYWGENNIQGVTEINTLILTSNRTRHDEQVFYVPFFPNWQFCLAFSPS
jgi:hypothetical protein